MEDHLILKDYPELPATLTGEERDVLQRCEATIRDGLDTFYAVAAALATVNRRKLYREDYSTFEAYCREKWQMGKAQAYRLIDADQVRENLSPIGDEVDLPKKESHIRALKKAPANLQADIWRGVQMSGQPVTATRIEEAVKEVLPKEEVKYEPHTDRQIISVACKQCGTLFEKPEDNPVVLCGDCVAKKLNKPLATDADIQQAVLDHAKSFRPFPEKALFELYPIANQVGDWTWKIKPLKEYIEQTYCWIPYYVWEQKIVEQAQKVLTSLEAMHQVELIRVNLDDKACQCMKCQKTTRSGLIYHYTKTDTYMCLMCQKTLNEDAERINEVHEKLDIDGNEEQEEPLTCEFCGIEYPESQLYTGDNDSPMICRECAIKASQSLINWQEPFGKEYNPENEKKPGTDEFWYNATELDRWDLFCRYQRYREKIGKIESEKMRLEVTIVQLKRDYENLVRKNTTLYERYVELRDKKRG